MKYALSFVLSLLCGSSFAAGPDLSSYFGKMEACLILRDLKTGKEEIRYGGKFCEIRQPACSTFKIPIALMAIDRGLIQDENTSFKWDGKKRMLEAWNRDQTAASWMKESVVWVSQELTPKIGMPAIKTYLQDFKYGNEDMSGGITQAWLSSTLKISPFEQTEFLRHLWLGELKLSSKSFELTKKLTYLGTSEKGSVLHGKTGSELERGQYRMGWFVGYLKNGEKEYVFSLDIKDSQKPLKKEFAGRESREIMKKILQDQGLF